MKINNYKKKNSWCNYFDSHKSIQHRKTKFGEKKRRCWLWNCRKKEDVSDSVTITFLNTKIGEVGKKVPDNSSLVANCCSKYKNWRSW